MSTSITCVESATRKISTVKSSYVGRKVEGDLKNLKPSLKPQGESQVQRSWIGSFSEPYRLDRTDNRGGLLLYVRFDIPSKFVVETTCEGMIVEL